MNAAALNVDYPILRNAGAGVEFGFGAEIVVERRVAHFDQQHDVAGHRVAAQLIGRAVQDGDVGLGFAGGVIFRCHVDAAGR